MLIVYVYTFLYLAKRHILCVMKDLFETRMASVLMTFQRWCSYPQVLIGGPAVICLSSHWLLICSIAHQICGSSTLDSTDSESHTHTHHKAAELWDHVEVILCETSMPDVQAGVPIYSLKVAGVISICNA